MAAARPAAAQKQVECCRERTNQKASFASVDFAELTLAALNNIQYRQGANGSGAAAEAAVQSSSFSTRINVKVLGAQHYRKCRYCAGIFFDSRRPPLPLSMSCPMRPVVHSSS